MSVLYVLIPLAIVLAAVAVAAFWYAVRQGQFDDTETPAVRMLFDDPPPREAERGEEGVRRSGGS